MIWNWLMISICNMPYLRMAYGMANWYTGPNDLDVASKPKEYLDRIYFLTSLRLVHER